MISPSLSFFRVTFFFFNQLKSWIQEHFLSRVFLTIFQVDTTACNTSLEGIASSCTGKVDLDREILPFVSPFN